MRLAEEITNQRKDIEMTNKRYGNSFDNTQTVQYLIELLKMNEPLQFTSFEQEIIKVFINGSSIFKSLFKSSDEKEIRLQKAKIFLKLLRNPRIKFVDDKTIKFGSDDFKYIDLTVEQVLVKKMKPIFQMALKEKRRIDFTLAEEISARKLMSLPFGQLKN